MAEVAARWLTVAHLGNFDDFGVTAEKSFAKQALEVFTCLNATLRSELRIQKSESGIFIELP